jgi:hypothetical protein
MTKLAGQEQSRLRSWLRCEADRSPDEAKRNPGEPRNANSGCAALHPGYKI